jgi:hypothetical protein
MELFKRGFLKYLSILIVEYYIIKRILPFFFLIFKFRSKIENFQLLIIIANCSLIRKSIATARRHLMSKLEKKNR